MNCRLCHQEFEITAEDFAFYQKIGVPSPKRCPKCRLVRRLMERNAKNLYYRKCDFSGKKIISPYHSDQPFPVYSTEIWWSDKWDALQYGQDFDFGRSFFDQFKELKNKTPHFAAFIIGGTLENSDFTNCTGYLKNCYLIGEADYDEDCYYSSRLNHCKNVMDSSFGYESELCYECVDFSSCYNLQYCRDCIGCQDSEFLFNCQSCINCVGCVNQRHKEYMILNEQFTKEKYGPAKSKLALHTRSGIEAFRKKFEAFRKLQPHKNLIGEHNENYLGDRLYNSKNSYFCFDSKDLEDCRYCVRLTLGVKNSMDYNSWGMNAELVYECSSCGDNIYNLKFCSTCTTNLADCEYCDQCTGSRDLFGCAGLKRKRYCILNKQYSKEKYFALRKKIVEYMKLTGEYGEFFPADICPFGYNETIAMEYFPLTKEEALAKRFQWRDPDPKDFQTQTFKIPDSIKDVPDSVSDEILSCSDCRKNYRIIPQELAFYRFLNIPLPMKCPSCRHISRMSLRNPPILWKRNCAKCNASIQTTYAADRPETVYCEKCYLEVAY